MSKRILLKTVAVIGLLFFWAAWANAELVVSEAYVRGLPPGQPNTAAFMTLSNTGDKAVEIIAVSSNASAKAEIHHSKNHNGMMSMEKLAGLTIAAGDSVTLQPGGRHLMLLGLHQPLSEGDEVKLQFNLSNGLAYAATLSVRSVLSEHHHHH